ncbi:hypothetical protein GGI43DRAFT_380720 [Trichoderma evansii]
MENYSLYGFRFESESLLLVSGQDELDYTEAEYEQWQHLLELDIQASISLLSPNCPYEANQISAAEHIIAQNHHTQDSGHQHDRRTNIAHRHLYQSQFIDRDSDPGSRDEGTVGIYRNGPQYLLDSPDEPIWQIIYSDSYQNRFDLGLNAYEHAMPINHGAGAPPITIANVSEGGNYAFRIMVESEEEHSHDEDSIFDILSEEEGTDDERGFESDNENDNEDSDSDMDLSKDDGNLESAEEDGEATYISGGNFLFWTSMVSFYDRNSPTESSGESILEIEWPSSVWQNAFNQTEKN